MNEYEQEMSSQKQLYEHQLDEMRKHIIELENQSQINKQQIKDKSISEQEGAQSVYILQRQLKEQQ